MITEIKLANIATYNSVSFTGLQRQNFIYGANGSGKTTLSNYLMDVSNSSYSDCSITWENNIPLQVLVYNKTFREKNFNSTGKIPGIFTIGEKSKETTDRIDEINKRLDELKKNTIGCLTSQKKFQLRISIPFSSVSIFTNMNTGTPSLPYCIVSIGALGIRC